MLPSIGFPEMLVIALLAIIVVGPKDLPKLMRTVGQWVARIRAMGNEFKSAFDDMGVDDEVAAIRREIEEMKSVANIEPELGGEMRALDQDLRRGTDLSSPHKPDPKPKPKTDAKPKAAAKPKPKSKAKPNATKAQLTSKAKPKAKPKAQPKTNSKPKAKAKVKPKPKAKPKPKPKVTRSDVGAPSDD